MICNRFLKIFVLDSVLNFRGFSSDGWKRNIKNSALLYGRTELYKCFEISYLTFSTMALKA